MADDLYGYWPEAKFAGSWRPAPSAVPSALLAQARPGGKILLTLSGWLCGYARVLLAVAEDGTFELVGKVGVGLGGRPVDAVDVQVVHSVLDGVFWDGGRVMDLFLYRRDTLKLPQLQVTRPPLYGLTVRESMPV
ncbi:hypothetical protein SUDANB51_08073 [Streptomyces sp. enrichment culture]